MPAIERGVRVIANPRIGRQQKRVGQIDPPVVIANDEFPFAVDRLKWRVVQQLIELGIEDVLTNQPTTVVGIPFEIFVFAGKQLVVIHIVPIRWRSQLALQLGSIVFPKFSGNPLGKLFTFRCRRLLSLLGWHLSKEKMVLCHVQYFQSGINSHLRQVIEPHVTFTGLRPMTLDAIAFKNAGGTFWHSKHIRSLRLSANGYHHGHHEHDEQNRTKQMNATFRCHEAIFDGRFQFETYLFVNRIVNMPLLYFIACKDRVNRLLGYCRKTTVPASTNIWYWC